MTIHGLSQAKQYFAEVIR